ncbi:MAG TPA: DNA polymerase Y family protein [Rhodocyclaceae bacterium]|nr:DNA polymerase Y family protein [Rhodocyclaceae bacterium]
MNPNPLWLALHLPLLPLEVGAPSPSPSAVVERGRILLGDDAARRAGIEAGTGVAAARLLVPAITLIARNASREAAALHGLACWAGGFTPRVSLTPDTLLLEIGACLRLFGGLERLVAAAREGVAAQGFTVWLAAATTPMGAQWLAKAGTAAICPDRDGLRRQLEALPIAVLPDKASASLSRFGASTLADVRRLPAAALARRIGVEALQLMARAFGEMPDPRADFVFPDRFALSLELPAAVKTAAALLFAARRLSSALAGWLAARQAGVRGLTLRLQHCQEETEIVLQFADLTRDAGRFERVLRERLERTVLRAPVESLRLEAANVSPRPGRSLALFDDAIAEHDAIGALLERLSARLGEERVHRVSAHDDHRPECATRHVAPFERARPGEATALPRPLWLLDPPESLAEVDGRPYRRGQLKLLAGPERIESGWWDGGEATGDIRRDYFVALSADARWLWVYRECRAPGGWFLHGFFS